ncbi:MAG: glycosyltransferase family 39 protein [Betaproteobacteria bacterium]|nr:glycosyltransferase family 39 protein [Betaproteobacteria bacterium]
MEPLNKSCTGATAPRRWLWLLLAVAVIWFGNIEYRKLIKPDEGRYAEIPREMVVSGDWVTPRLNGLKYFEKPPLQYWATATAYTVFGEHQWTSRLWTALTGFAGLLLVWYAGTRLFGCAAGRYAAMLLGGSLLYVLMAHINTLDMGVTFFITLGIAGLLLGQQAESDARTRRNWMYLAWAALGLAVLSKGLMGLVLPGAALFLYSVAQRDIAVWKRMHWGAGLLLFLLVTAPWFYLVMQANPEFFQRFFIYEHYLRFTTKVHARYQPWHYFIPVLLAGMLPWTILMFDTLVRTWKNSARTDKAFNPERFLLIWAVFIYVFFSVSSSKLPSYLLPMFPALALLMGKQVAEMNVRRLFWLVFPALPLGLLALGLAPFTARLADTPLQVQMYGEYAYWLAAAALIWLLGTVSAWVFLRRDNKTVAVLALALGSLLAAQIGTSGYNIIAKERSAYLIADAIRPYVKADVPFYSVADYEQTLPFYLKRTFTLVQYQDEMAFGIMQEPQRWIPDIASFAKVWQAQPEALAIIPVYMYQQLKQQELAMKIIFENTQYIVVSKP